MYVFPAPSCITHSLALKCSYSVDVCICCVEYVQTGDHLSYIRKMQQLEALGDSQLPVLFRVAYVFCISGEVLDSS